MNLRKILWGICLLGVFVLLLGVFVPTLLNAFGIIGREYDILTEWISIVAMSLFVFILYRHWYRHLGEKT
jgi:ABC-type Na+ efflux pump permease subunit